MLPFPSFPQPIVQAPMAGGPSTPELTAAVSEAGGFGFLAAGYKSVAAVEAELARTRQLTQRPFGLNLFVPTPPPADPAALQRYLARIAPEAERYGVQLGAASHDDDAWADKLELALRLRPAVLSFAFGCPEPALLERLRRAGIASWITVTEPAEAERAEAAGADALVVQGVEAGGHRGTFEDRDGVGEVGLLALLRLCARRSALPLVAAGGIADGWGVAAVLAAGARAAQIGTGFLRCPEAATNPAHRKALAAAATSTALTRAFSGRRARGIVNRFLREHSAEAPQAYPNIVRATSQLRAAGARAADPEVVNLWAGQAYPLAEERSAAELIATWSREAREALRRADQAFG
ncbi:MAG TPA: nitronate monooxygenase [Polyangiales bacterium]|nr:nitronate monooxygenase [Polyangiales bacterium]